MAGQVNIEATASTSASEMENEKTGGRFSKCSAKLSYNEDGTPTAVDGSYVFIKDNGCSISLNCNLIDVKIDNQVVRVIGDDNSVEEISLDCTDPLYELDNETGTNVDLDQNADSNEVANEPLLGEAWGDAPTRLLISLYGDLILEVKTRKIRTFKAMWEKMSELMVKRGYKFSACQVSNRFKTLKRSYMKRKYDRKHRRFQKGRIRPFLRRCPYERELEEMFAIQAEVFPESMQFLDEDAIFRAQFMTTGSGLDVSQFLDEDEELQQFADAESNTYATPVVQLVDHMDYVEPLSGGGNTAATSRPETRRRTRPNALDELRNLRASTLERLTCMDVKRDAFHEEVLEELRHKNSMLEKLLELVTKEPLH